MSFWKRAGNFIVDGLSMPVNAVVRSVGGNPPRKMKSNAFQKFDAFGAKIQGTTNKIAATAAGALLGSGTIKGDQAKQLAGGIGGGQLGGQAGGFNVEGLQNLFGGGASSGGKGGGNNVLYIVGAAFLLIVIVLFKK